ncbi:Protein of unknown function [Gryllus bimaculatus]|nr:Protein of unknown function [Gryllus bimaculatus]
MASGRFTSKRGCAMSISMQRLCAAVSRISQKVVAILKKKVLCRIENEFITVASDDKHLATKG